MGSIPRKLGRLLAAVPVVTVLALAAPATAEESKHRDPAQDVTDQATIGADPTSAPGDKNRDIRSIRTVYADDKLAVTITLRNLGTNYKLYTRVLTDTGDGFTIINDDAPGTGEDLLELFHYPVVPRGVAPTPCEGMTVTRIPEKERIRTVVPRTCLESPTSLRTGAHIQAELGNGHYRVDDARRNGTNAGVFNGAQARLGSSVSYD